MSSPYRVGVGTDAHRVTSDRPLFLGGVEIPGSPGLDAHSDGDVLSHAILDALLGAAGLGDKGVLFPPSDAQFRDIRSTDLLHRAMMEIAGAGWEVGNVDASVICEQPRLSPYREAMRDEIASALGIDKSCVSIKGTTFEGMGFTGRREGIAAVAVAILFQA